MDISSNSKPNWEEPIQKNQRQKSLLYCPFKLLYEPEAQPLQRKVLILLSSTDFFCLIYFVSLFLLYIHFVSHAKISVSLWSETSETNPLFRLEAKFFSLPFSHRFAYKRNERRTLGTFNLECKGFVYNLLNDLLLLLVYLINKN